MQDILGASLAFGAFFLLSFVPFFLLLLGIPYAVLRLQNEQPADPQLGTKVGLQYFFSVAILIGLTGLTIMAVDLITREWGGAPVRPPQQPQPFGRPNVAPVDNDLFNAAQRTGLGMVLSGLLGTAIHFLMGFGLTSKLHWHRVRRLFVGARFAVHGIVVTFAGSGLIIMLLQKDVAEPNTFRAVKAFFAILAVWTPSWAIHFGLLRLSAWLTSEAPRPALLNEEI